MGQYKITRGKNLKITGVADKTIVNAPFPKQVAVQPPDLPGLRLRLAVKEGDAVKVGSVLATDKTHEDIKIVSSASGTVAGINRGAKRALMSIVVKTDGKQTAESFHKYSDTDAKNLKRDVVVKALLDSGLWPVLRERPFSDVANPDIQPKSIFIHAMNTEPLAADISFVLEGKEKLFQAGLDIIKQLTSGSVHLCYDEGSSSAALTGANRVQSHQFSGPHPTGNVSTHIHHVDPINKGDIVWYIEAQDVLRIASLFLDGQYPTERIVAVTGEGAAKKVYFKTILGVSLKTLLEGSNLEGHRCLTGSVLAGRDVGAEGFLGFYDSQITIIPEGGNRELLGWLVPGFKKYTLSHTYASAFVPKSEYSVDTDENGGHRAIVLNHLYDELVPLDIMTYFLLKAVIAEDIEESEKLGILECDEEDFALCTFACPSKTDVGAIIRSGLNTIRDEG